MKKDSSANGGQDMRRDKKQHATPGSVGSGPMPFFLTFFFFAFFFSIFCVFQSLNFVKLDIPKSEHFSSLNFFQNLNFQNPNKF
jgi:hypothetical protein